MRHIAIIATVLCLASLLGAPNCVSAQHRVRERRYINASEAELSRVERDAETDTALGVALLLSGLAVGVGAALPLGLASQHPRPCGAFAILDVCVSYDDGLLAGALAAAAVGFGLLLGSVLGLILPSERRRRDVQDERRARTSVAVDVTSFGAAIVWRGTF